MISRIVVFGSINVDLVCRVASIARPGETVLARRYERLFGGKGANQAVAAARASAQAGAVAMIGALGTDDLGDAALADLARNGVGTSGILRLDEPTGCAFIAVDEAGENAITVASGANAGLTVPPGLDGLLDAGTVLVLQMETPFEANLDAARLAAGRGASIVWNIAPVSAALTAARLAELLPLVDVLVANESELGDAAALCGIAAGDVEACAKAMAARFSTRVIATLGARGAIVAVDAADPVHRVAARPVEAVDTTGAGDTFVGVLAAGLSEGLGVEAATQRAVVAASLACLGHGAQTAMPHRSEIDAAVSEGPREGPPDDRKSLKGRL